MRTRNQHPEPRPIRKPLHVPLWVMLTVVVLSSLIYLPTIRYGFVWDDHYLIEQNESLAHTSVAQVFTREFFYNPGYHDSQLRMTYYRPLATLSFFLDRKVWGVNPLGYHLTNVLLHAVVSLLLFLALIRCFPRLPALAAALVFSVHPAFNSVVAWISGRNYLLAALFVLAAFLALLSGRRRRSPALILGFGLLMLLAMLSQESAILFVAVAAGWVLVQHREYPWLAGWLAAPAVAAVAYVVLRLAVAHVPLPAESVGPILRQPFGIVNSFGQQLLLFFVPFIQKVAYVASPALTNFSGYTVLGLALLVLPLIPAFRRPSHVVRSALPAGQSPVRPRPDVFRWLGYGWTLVLLLPFAHLTTLGPSGRTMYLPATGILIFILALVERARKSKSLRDRSGPTRIAWLLAVLVVVAFAVRTWRRIPIWRDENTLNRVKVNEAPNSPEAHDNRGIKLREAGDIEGAIREHRRAIELKPDFSTAHNNLGTALFEAGRMPEAITEYREALRLDADFAMAHNNLGVALQESGDLANAETEYRQALKLEPGLALAHNNLGEILMHAGQTDSAIIEYRQALVTQPNYALAHCNLGVALEKQGKLDEAIREYQQTLKIMPDFRQARDRLDRLQQSRDSGKP